MDKKIISKKAAEKKEIKEVTGEPNSSKNKPLSSEVPENREIISVVSPIYSTKEEITLTELPSPPKKQSILPPKMSRIAVYCTSCHASHVITREQFDDFICTKCGHSSFNLGYLCINCNKIYPLSKKDFIALKAPEKVRCFKCNTVAEIFKKKKTKAVSRKVPEKIEIKNVVSTPDSTKSGIAVYCASCHALHVITREQFDHFGCGRCGHPSFNVGYLCTNCNKIYPLSERDFVALKAPEKVRCFKCNTVAEIFKKKKTKVISRKVPEKIEIKNVMSTLDSTKNESNLSEKQPALKEEPFIQAEKSGIAAYCALCHALHVITREQFDDFGCGRCGHPSFNVGYLCTNCNKIYPLSKRDFIAIKAPENVRCFKCNTVAEIFKKKRTKAVSKTVLQKKGINNVVNSYGTSINKSLLNKKLPLPKEGPIIPPQNLKFAVYCASCNAPHSIMREQFEHFRCGRCGHPSFNLGYLCTNCNKIYPLSKKLFVALKDPEKVRCLKCNTMTEIFKSKRTKFIPRQIPESKGIKSVVSTPDSTKKKSLLSKKRPALKKKLIIPPQKSKFAAYCASCNAPHSITREQFDRFSCEKCGVPFFKLGYLCTNCNKIYPLPKNKFVLLKDPEKVRCIKCNTMSEIFKKK